MCWCAVKKLLTHTHSTYFVLAISEKLESEPRPTIPLLFVRHLDKKHIPYIENDLFLSCWVGLISIRFFSFFVNRFCNPLSTFLLCLQALVLGLVRAGTATAAVISAHRPCGNLVSMTGSSTMLSAGSAVGVVVTIGAAAAVTVAAAVDVDVAAAAVAVRRRRRVLAPWPAVSGGRLYSWSAPPACRRWSNSVRAGGSGTSLVIAGSGSSICWRNTVCSYLCIRLLYLNNEHKTKS